MGGLPVLKGDKTSTSQKGSNCKEEGKYKRLPTNEDTTKNKPTTRIRTTQKGTTLQLRQNDAISLPVNSKRLHTFI